jgi:plastocyanin
MNRIRTTVLASAAGVVVLAGSAVAVEAASASPHTTHAQTSIATKAPTKGTITIKNYGFSGPGTVAPGALVTVRNRDSVTHTVTANSGHKFNVTVGAHKTKTFRAPHKAGTYRFHCAIHAEMKGSLKVK